MTAKHITRDNHSFLGLTTRDATHHPPLRIFPSTSQKPNRNPTDPTQSLFLGCKKTQEKKILNIIIIAQTASNPFA